MREAKPANEFLAKVHSICKRRKNKHKVSEVEADRGVQRQKKASVAVVYQAM